MAIAVAIQSQDYQSLFEPNPIGRLCRCWERGERPWPQKPEGDPALFHIAAVHGYPEREANRIEGYLGSKEGRPTAQAPFDRTLWKDRRRIVHTAIRLYANEKKWIGDNPASFKGIAGTLCGFGALRDGAIVCLTAAEQQRLRGIVRGLVEKQDIDLDLPVPEVVILTVEQLKGQRFLEVFVSAEINPATTPRDQMLRVFGSARVGLHLVGAPAG
ncbi:hypothetical protein KQ306_03360 [Synechococcus sp. CS-1324]|uniref:hypothetical protein n=1 Tax=Synechococcus sp. CS-1324 TaxID=2847980 RepID=UPI000DB4BEFB|nr:hypothetical protein [Synechococcus sp. CS-1324]MCT0229902.1 hypothetical protein [Synechococcus sp. CS-1324]PZV06303.1 MAG: hypothetical protein DCF23_00515 [Cyanobium sp.]